MAKKYKILKLKNLKKLAPQLYMHVDMYKINHEYCIHASCTCICMYMYKS